MKKSLSVPEVTELLLLKNDETVRRFIREGKKLNFDLPRIAKLSSKESGYYSLCIENENAKPYKITADSVALLLSRRLNKTEEEANNIIKEFQSKKSKQHQTNNTTPSYTYVEEPAQQCTISNVGIRINKIDVPNMTNAPSQQDVKSYMRFMNARKDILAENIMMHNAQIGEVKAQITMLEHQLIHFKSVLNELEASLSKETEDLEKTKTAIYKYLEELTL